jgi:hypothetical protein
MILIKIVEKESNQKISQKLLDWIDNFNYECETIEEIIELCQNKKNEFQNEINVIEAKNKVLNDIQKIIKETNNVYRISDILENSARYLTSRVTNQRYYYNYSSLIEYLKPYNNEKYQIFYKYVNTSEGHENY